MSERRARSASRWSREGAAQRGILAAAAAVACAVAAWWILGGGLARGMIYPGNLMPLPEQAALAPGLQRIEYVTEDGLMLRGLVVRANASSAAPAPSARPPTLILFHGNAQAALHLSSLAQALAEAGSHVLVAEYRGYGGCEGSPCEEGLLADGRAALAAAREHLDAAPEEVVLVGLSLGTGVAAGLAGEGFGRGVALVAPFTSMTAMARRVAPEWLVSLGLRDRYPSLAALEGRDDLPVLVLHGTDDPLIPFAHGQEIVETLGFERARLIPLEGIAHNDVLSRAGERVVAEITSFARAGRGPR